MIVTELEVSNTCGVVSTRGTTIFVPVRPSCRHREGFLIRGMGPYLQRVALALQTQASKQSDGGVGVSTPCGAISTRGTTVFVPGLLEL